jgi:hypothetical protein
MQNTNFQTPKCAKPLFLVAFVFVPMLFGGCAHTGGASSRTSSILSNPAMYNYNPATRDFETRWPFGPANFH